MVRRAICAVLVMVLGLLQGSIFSQIPVRTDPVKSQYEAVFLNYEKTVDNEKKEDENLSISSEAEYGEKRDKTKSKKDADKRIDTGSDSSVSSGNSVDYFFTGTSGNSGNNYAKPVDHTSAQSTETVPDSYKISSSEKRDKTENQSSETGKQPANDTEETESETYTLKEPTHVHYWVTETIHHDAVTHTEHHDAVTDQRWISVPVSFTKYYCDVCGAEFSSQSEAYAHEDATYSIAMESGDMSLIHSGHYSRTETTDNGYWETVIVSEANNETIIDEPAWDEYRTVCSVCGATG